MMVRGCMMAGIPFSRFGVSILQKSLQALEFCTEFRTPFSTEFSTRLAFREALEPSRSAGRMDAHGKRATEGPIAGRRHKFAL